MGLPLAQTGRTERGPARSGPRWDGDACRTRRLGGGPALGQQFKASWPATGVFLAACLFAAVARAEPGDVERGRALVADRTQSLCLLCHALTAAGDANQGNLAPPLDSAARRLSAKGLRDRIADMRRFNPATVMPPFRATEGLRDVAPAWQGRAVLSEQQLDDIVAYLATLTP